MCATHWVTDGVSLRDHAVPHVCPSGGMGSSRARSAALDCGGGAALDVLVDEDGKEDGKSDGGAEDGALVPWPDTVVAHALSETAHAATSATSARVRRLRRITPRAVARTMSRPV